MEKLCTEIRKEAEILKAVLYRARNQHRNTRYYRRMRHLHSVARHEQLSGKDMEKMRQLAEGAYVTVSQNITATKSLFFEMSVVFLAISARLYTLADRALELLDEETDATDEIETIFEGC